MQTILEKNIFALVGKNVSFQTRLIPVYSELIKLHDNVRIARNVDFCTHDGIHNLLNRCNKYDYNFMRKLAVLKLWKIVL